MERQMTLFDLTRQMIEINKPIRLIELFAGYGSQAMALRNIGADFERYLAVEIDKYAMASYNAVHGTDFPEMDICKMHGSDLKIVDKDKYCYLMFYSFPCFPKGTLVTTETGLKDITDIEIGDSVLTHGNKYCKVVNKRCVGTRSIMQIRGMGIDKINCTENHKFYVREMTRRYPRLKNGKRKKVRIFSEPTWVECKDLSKKHYLGVAINQRSTVPKWDGIDYQWSDGRKGRHKNELSKYMGNDDFWWIIGRYVGDGWHRTQGGIVICSNKKETSIITDIADRIELKYSVSKERTVDKIHFPSKELEKFVSPFGRGAANKQIPGFVFDLPKNLVKSFIDGYVSADGCFTNNRFKTSSISRKLSYGIAQLVAKAYETPYSIYENKRKPISEIEGRKIKQKTAYVVAWKTEKRKQDKAFYEDGYIWFPIQDIKRVENEEVYDIEIEEDHSFCANGVIVHNCTDLSVAGRMQGMDEDSGTNSALLWEVKRLLEETDELPQILIMENVTAVHSNENIANFHKWLDFLSDKGYVSYVDDLNAKDYGVAQNRDRTFCVSLLGEYNYHFPKQIELRYVMKDYLEENVDEKYYINSDKANDLIQKLIDDGTLADDDEEPNDNKWTTDLCKDPSERDISLAITARQDRGISNRSSTGGGNR